MQLQLCDGIKKTVQPESTLTGQSRRMHKSQTTAESRAGNTLRRMTNHMEKITDKYTPNIYHINDDETVLEFSNKW